MFSSSRIFRHLCKRRTTGAIHKNYFKTAPLTNNKIFQEVVSDPAILGFQTYSEVQHSDILHTRDVLKPYCRPEAIEWDEVLKKLAKNKAFDPKQAVISTCRKFGEVDVGISYLKYVMAKGETLTTEEMLFFCKLLSNYRERFPDYEKLVECLYEQIKPYMLSSLPLKSEVLKMFLNVPSCYKDFVDSLKKVKTQGNQEVIFQALEINDPETAWHFIQDPDFFATSKFLRAYVNYCTKRALEGKFSVNLITDVTNMCFSKMNCLVTNNLEYELKPLIRALELNKNDYTLSAQPCRINNEDICSNCGHKLNPIHLSRAEVKELEENFFNLFLKSQWLSTYSSEKEVNDFKKFLENCKPYDVVLDGLNLLYKGKFVGVNCYNQFLKYFLDKGWKVLGIGRKHFMRSIANPNTREKKLGDNYQHFLTLNETNDDLFVLYAALHGGPKTFVCSGDHLSPYSSYFPDRIKKLFQKWKISHQFVMHSRFSLLKPWFHMGLPQLTRGPTKNGEYIWHISHHIANTTGHLSRDKTINWLCLKATPRRNDS